MSLCRITAFALAGLIALAPLAGQAQEVDPAIANLTAEEAVEARQNAMRQNGGILRGAANLTGADAVAAADDLIENLTNLLHLFPENSIVGDSRALPVIWEEFDEFSGYFATGLEAATAMRSAAETGDAATYAASIKTMGGLCGQCHDKFRAPED